MNNIFLPEKFFDLSKISFSEIFNDVENAWDVLAKIESYIKFQFDSKSKTSNYEKADNVHIGEGTIIEEGVKILGPAIIGRNCIIGHASFIRENCLLADNVKIGHGCEIKNSIFLDSSIAAHLNYVGDSLIGNGVNISGGAMLANFRFDKKNVSVRYGSEKIQTNLLKFSSIVGDNSTIGVNAVLNPGTTLGKSSIVYPLISVFGVHQDREIIK